MIKLQVSITPSEAKRLIAKAISNMPEVSQALQNGKILLKAGTTVSAVAEELAGVSLRISGRITKNGAKSPAEIMRPHQLYLEGKQIIEVETEAILSEIAMQMGKGDILITGFP